MAEVPVTELIKLQVKMEDIPHKVTYTTVGGESDLQGVAAGTGHSVWWM